MTAWTQRLGWMGLMAGGVVALQGCNNKTYDETGVARRANASRSEMQRPVRNDTDLNGTRDLKAASRMDTAPIAASTGSAAAPIVTDEVAAADQTGIGGSGSVDATDLLSKLHHTDEMEIQMGELAKSHGKAKGVREYGERLVKDHRAADTDVSAYATKHQLTLGAPTSVGAEEMKAHQAKMNELKTSKEAGFDQKFLAAMIEGHEKAIAEVTAARDATSEPELKAMLDKMLPTLKEHRDIAHKLESGRTAMSQ